MALIPVQPAQEADEHPDVEDEPQTQRRRISTANEDETGLDGEPQGDNDQDQMVKNLVRLALAKEYSRGVLRRTDINEKGMSCLWYRSRADTEYMSQCSGHTHANSNQCFSKHSNNCEQYSVWR